MTPDDIRRAAEGLIARTVTARGLPRTVADPRVLAPLAALFVAHKEAVAGCLPRRPREVRADAARSEPAA